MAEMLSGNEAIARGAWEAGVRLASAYPGTPSTEILENLSKYEGVYCEWSPNEKVAMEVATGASWAGARTLVTMKHVGLNVAADPFFSVGMTGVEGGMVIVSADDPGMHSSQDEQDNRNYGKFARVPVLEPADAGEARDFVKAAYDLSETYDTPVLLRTTTRTSHSKSIVEFGERPALEPLTKLTKNWAKYTMMPVNAMVRHHVIEERIKILAEYAETCPFNTVEMGDTRVGIISAGAAYTYAREAYPQASFLKLGMTYPLPTKLIADFRAKVDKLYIVEELDPFIEDHIRLQGVKIDGGKDVVPLCGELDPGLVARVLHGAGVPGVDESLLTTPTPVVEGLVGRPPTLCPGCSHRGVFTILKKLRVFVSGDIGCYALGGLPPFEAMHCSTCMGASISMAHGMAKVLEPSADGKDKVVAVLGDSTFFHTGINSLMDVAYNKSRVLTLILDNRTTAMTGGQENPGSGKTLLREPAQEVDIPGLCRDMGLTRVREIDPYDLAETEAALKEELAADGPSVVITKAPCVLQFRIKEPAYRIDAELCIGCKRCLQAGCMALNLYEDENGDRKVEIHADQCAGCGVCSQLCKEGAILPPTEGGTGLRKVKGGEA
jgi:indolepyruvate ferredoxin oxidoreductase alpha subunit